MTMKGELIARNKAWCPPDNVRYAKLQGKGMWFARLAICVDGTTHAFCAYSKNKEEAIRDVNSYLDPECYCIRGQHPWCDVHEC